MHRSKRLQIRAAYDSHVLESWRVRVLSSEAPVQPVLLRFSEAVPDHSPVVLSQPLFFVAAAAVRVAASLFSVMKRFVMPCAMRLGCMDIMCCGVSACVCCGPSRSDCVFTGVGCVHVVAADWS